MRFPVARSRERFGDRSAAGRQLAARLEDYRGTDTVVAGLPRGGVPVAFEIAVALDLELDVIVVRKLGAPWQPELALGAVGENGVRVLNAAVAATTGIGDDELAAIERRETAEVARRAALFRAGREGAPLVGRGVIVVDDGVATGATTRAACEVARATGARKVVLAVPVAPAESLAELAASADELVCLLAPTGFSSVGEWYDNFTQTSDAEVIALLEAAATRRAPPDESATDP
ncbi:MAG TPA: phosphoribosyltransferase family protein [Acidimicrobiales bacterium]|nr:phosphoribosyltransferase family protein [Acidimicrobiales bacterium]